jgi:hypothetical protein
MCLVGYQEVEEVVAVVVAVVCGYLVSILKYFQITGVFWKMTDIYKYWPTNCSTYSN